MPLTYTKTADLLMTAVGTGKVLSGFCSDFVRTYSIRINFVQILSGPYFMLEILYQVSKLFEVSIHCYLVF